MILMLTALHAPTSRSLRRLVLFICLPCCLSNVSLQWLLSDAARDSLSEALVAQLLKQMLTAVRSLHAHGLVHRDVKPENFVFTADPLIYVPEPMGPMEPARAISTFGERSAQLKLVDVAGTMVFPELTEPETSVGTAYYMAPETINEDDPNYGGRPTPEVYPPSFLPPPSPPSVSSYRCMLLSCLRRTLLTC